MPLPPLPEIQPPDLLSGGLGNKVNAIREAAVKDLKLDFTTGVELVLTREDNIEVRINLLDAFDRKGTKATADVPDAEPGVAGIVPLSEDSDVDPENPNPNPSEYVALSVLHFFYYLQAGGYLKAFVENPQPGQVLQYTLDDEGKVKLTNVLTGIDQILKNGNTSNRTLTIRQIFITAPPSADPTNAQLQVAVYNATTKGIEIMPLSSLPSGGGAVKNSLIPNSRKPILTIGSSHITGFNVPGETSYADLVGAELVAAGTHSYTSIAVPGTDTVYWLARINADLTQYKPDFVWVGLSLGNEWANNADHDAVFNQFYRNMVTLANFIRANGAIPLISGVYPRIDYSAADYRRIKNMDRLLGDAGYVTFSILTVNNDGAGHYMPQFDNGDGLHVNPLGHQTQAACIPRDAFQTAPLFYGPLRMNRTTAGVKIAVANLANPIITQLSVQSVTIGFDVKMDTPTAETFGLILLGGTAERIRIRTPNGQLWVGTQAADFISSDKVLAPTWQHVAIKYNHATGLVVLFVDGVRIGSNTTTLGLRFTNIVLGGVESASNTAVGCDFRNLTIHQSPLPDELISDLARGIVNRGSLLLFSTLAEGNPTYVGQKFSNQTGYSISAICNQDGGSNPIYSTPAVTANGLETFLAQPVAGDVVYAPLADFAPDNAANYSHARMDISLSTWGAIGKKTIYFDGSNRDSIRFKTICVGDPRRGGALVAYRRSDGHVILYARNTVDAVYNNGYNEDSILYLKMLQVTPLVSAKKGLTYSSDVPSGVVVYDSDNEKYNLVITPDGISTASLPESMNPLNVLTRNIYTGAFEASTLENFMLKALTVVSDTVIQKICERLSAIGCSNGGGTATDDFIFGSHYVSTAVTTPPVTPPNYVIYVQENTCNIITGYVYDSTRPNVPQAVDIFDNEQLIATITATNTRSIIAAQIGGNASSLYGWQYIVPASLRDGKVHTRRIYIRDGDVQATYGQPQTTPICAVPNQPYIVQFIIVGPGIIQELSAQAVYSLSARYSDGSTIPYVQAGIAWQIVGGTPASVTTQTLGSNGEQFGVTVGDIATSVNITVRATVGTSPADAIVQLIDNTCHRPANMNLRPQLAFNYITTDGNAHLFTTLDDANNTMGRIFNEAGIGISNYTAFAAELNSYADGTDVFLNWSPSDTSCAKVSDGIYYVLDGDKQDGQKIAVQIAGGKIVTAKPSTYVKPNTAPIKVTIQRLGYVNDPATGGEYQVKLRFYSLDPSKAWADIANQFEVQLDLQGSGGSGPGDWKTTTAEATYYNPWGTQSIPIRTVLRLRKTGQPNALAEFVIYEGNETRPRHDDAEITLYQS